MIYDTDDQTPDSKPVSSLVSDALQQFKRLIRSEVALARAELMQKAQQAGKGGVLVAIAALLVIPSAGVLLVALAALFMEWGLRGSLAYLLAAIIGFAVATALALMGVSRLKADSLVPRRTLNQLHRDVVTAKEQF